MRDLGRSILDAVSSHISTHIDWKIRQRELAHAFTEARVRAAQAELESEAEEEGDPSPRPPASSMRRQQAAL